MEIGTNAGVVWRILFEEKTGMNLDTLMSRSNLPLFDVAAAIGWLARENKIWMTNTEDGNLRLSVYPEFYF